MQKNRDETDPAECLQALQEVIAKICVIHFMLFNKQSFCLPIAIAILSCSLCLLSDTGKSKISSEETIL